MLKLAYHTILLQEVPDEISLGLVFSGCPIGCPDCHSKEYWSDDSGKEFDLDALLEQYKGMITCVCFMGGEWERTHFLKLIQKVKNNDLKTCLYTGLSTVELVQYGYSYLINPCYLDYIKTGPYIKTYGGLQVKNTNQRFFKIKSKDLIIDMTSTFEVKNETTKRRSNSRKT